jgi:hypothetical protein
MNALQVYLKYIVEPTYADFKSNPRSTRHAYLACVTAFHSIDRAVYPKSPGNLRKEWRKRSLEFTIVDMVAHKLKHVVSDDEKGPAPKDAIRLSTVVFGFGTLNTVGLNEIGINEGGLDLHNLHFVIRDAIKFLHEEAMKLPNANEVSNIS